MNLQTIKAQREFDLIYKKGKSFYGNYFTLRFLLQKNVNLPTKYGLVISAKEIKSSVDRNRKKRQMREIIRKSCEKIRPGFFFLFIFKNASLSASYEELEKEFERLGRKSGLIK